VARRPCCKSTRIPSARECENWGSTGGDFASRTIPTIDAGTEDAGWFWNHAEDRYQITHDYLFANYVCSSGKHYPLKFRRFKKREQCRAEDRQFRDHGVLFRELVNWVVAHQIPGDFTFDTGLFTSAPCPARGRQLGQRPAPGRLF